MKSVTFLLIAVVAMASAAQAQVDPRVVAGNTDFGLKLFKQFVKASGGKNVTMSPASVSIALSMTYNGAGGSTATAMSKALGYNGISLDQVNAANKALISELTQPGRGLVVSIANSLWARKGVQFKPDFLQRNKDFYGAEIAALDLGTAASRINSWVSDKTHGKIKGIVDQVDPSTILFLVNAVYFNGTWTTPFDPKATVQFPFTLASGSPVFVQMMNQTDHYQYLEGDKFQMVKLDYGAGRWSMYVVLPAQDSSLDALYSQLTTENWQKWMGQAERRKVFLSMPRFKIEYETEAKDALSALGMKVAFDPMKASFGNMCRIPPSPNVYISAVKHKAVVEVNERGTEAAAATSVGMSATAMPIAEPPPVTMVVNRPFFFAIRDNPTGEILFLGSVTDPR